MFERIRIAHDFTIAYIVVYSSPFGEDPKIGVRELTYYQPTIVLLLVVVPLLLFLILQAESYFVSRPSDQLVLDQRSLPYHPFHLMRVTQWYNSAIILLFTIR